MSVRSRRWRRWATALAQHAVCVMPAARASWAEAMRRELDHIADDPAALRWALGSVLVSYRARLLRPPQVSARAAWHVVASAGVMMVIGLALQDHAGGQTPRSQPIAGATSCDRSPGEPAENSRSRTVSRHRSPEIADGAVLADPHSPDTADVCKASEIPRGR
jgi:hypothetical protein